MSVRSELPKRTRNALDRDPDVLKVDAENFLVEGRSKDWYTVDLGSMECSCPDHVHRGSVCYHMRAAALKDERGETVSV